MQETEDNDVDMIDSISTIDGEIFFVAQSIRLCMCNAYQ